MLPSAQEEEVEVDEFPVDPDVSCCLLIKFYLFCSLNFVFFLLQSEEGKAQEASKKEFQQTEKLKNLFSDCNIFLSREVPREILVFVIRYKWYHCMYSSSSMCEHPSQTTKILKSVFHQSTVVESSYRGPPPWPMGRSIPSLSFFSLLGDFCGSFCFLNV